MWCGGLNFDDWYEKYEQICEQDYLHGYCDEWVLKNFKNGDKVVAILEERENIETLCLLHTCLLRNEMFLDVRRETKNFNDILDGFDYGIFDVVELENVKDFKKLMKNIGVF